MVQSRQGLRVSGSRWSGRDRGHFRAHGNGAPRGDQRPRARAEVAGADRGGEEGADRGRGARRLTSRLALAAMVCGMAALGACQPTTGSNSGSALEASPAGLQQVPLTVTTAAGKVHRFTVEVARSEAQ